MISPATSQTYTTVMPDGELPAGAVQWLDTGSSGTLWGKHAAREMRSGGGVSSPSLRAKEALAMRWQANSACSRGRDSDLKLAFVSLLQLVLK
jgi:hypothetical protein